MFPAAFLPFIEKRPIGVMARAIVERFFEPTHLDDLFRRTAVKQVERNLLFSSVVDLMQGVVLGVEPSVFAAYSKRQKTFPVSDQALYDKLQGIELGVSAALVHDSGQHAAEKRSTRWRRGVRRGCQAIACAFSTAMRQRRPSIVWSRCATSGRRRCPARFWWSWIRNSAWLAMRS